MRKKGPREWGLEFLEPWGPDGIFFLPLLGYFPVLTSCPFIGRYFRKLFLAPITYHLLWQLQVPQRAQELGLPTRARARAGERAPRTWPHPSRRKESSQIGMGSGGKRGSNFGLQAHPGSGQKRETPAALVRKGGFTTRLPRAEGLGD